MTPLDLMTDAVARLRLLAGEQPEAVLLRTRERSYTYAAALHRATAVAAALRAAGVEATGFASPMKFSYSAGMRP